MSLQAAWSVTPASKMQCSLGVSAQQMWTDVSLIRAPTPQALFPDSSTGLLSELCTGHVVGERFFSICSNPDMLNCSYRQADTCLN